MEINEVIKRINILAQKKREGTLTEEDIAEKKKLYEIYLNFIRGQVTQTLDRIEFVDQQPSSSEKLH